MLRSLIVSSPFLLMLSCAGRELNSPTATPQDNKNPVTSSSTQEEKTTGQPTVSSAEKLIPPAPIEPPISFKDILLRLEGGATLRVRLRAGSTQDELLIHQNEPLSTVNFEFFHFWLQTIADDAGLTLDSLNLETQSDRKTEPPIVFRLSLSESAADAHQPVAEFLHNIQHPNRDSFQRAVLRAKEVRTQKTERARQLLLNALRKQMGLQTKTTERFDLLACELENWLSNIQITWDYSIQPDKRALIEPP